MRRQILNYCADQTNQDQEAEQHKLLQSAFPKISASLYLNIESNQISHLPKYHDNRNQTSKMLDLHNQCPSAFLRTRTPQLRLVYAINPGSQTLFHNHHYPLVIQNSKPLIFETTESNGTRITKIDHALDSDLPLNFECCFLDTSIREVQL
jgi:hypothetical protein